MPLRPNEILIDDANWKFHISPVVDGEQKMHGLVPRDWSRIPCGSIAGVPQAAIPKIPRSEWSARIKEMTEKKALLSDVRNIGNNGQRIPSRDQKGKGYCWAHSTVGAALLARAKDNQPYADLSAYAIACIIKGYRDEGGWNGESMKFLRERGCPTSEFWPQQSMNRSNDKPETWVNAALHKNTEWEDVPDRDFDMLFTYLLLGCPCPLDLNWWRHSICAADPVEVEAGHYGVRIWNSWGDSWSDNGMGVLTETKAIPDGAMALRVMTASIT